MADKEQKPIRTAVTKESLMAALQSVGVGPNMILEVHSSLSSLGYVVGGARTVVDALMELSEPGGTILMATQTADNSDPSSWQNPPAAPETWKTIRENMPAYDPEATDLSEMGAVAENFRHRAGVVSSCHPSDSYAAWGRYAKLLCNRQSMHFPLAEESPAARLYE
ncbi:MAG: aminoglycoside N(3)-acetyltransferase, partial [Bulleidia sp.]